MNFEDDLREVQKSDKSTVGKIAKSRTSSEQAPHRWQTRTEQALVPSINNTNSTNSLNLVNEGIPEQTEKIDVKVLRSLGLGLEKKEKNFAKKERRSLSPELDEVQEYFLSQEYPSIEAEKFFNYFESNGWLVGGKTKMKDWQAAARNWILNTGKFNNTPKPTHRHASVEKNYGEPL
jgi:hypothetical protein